MIATYRLIRGWIDAINDKRVARALGYDRGTVHRMARHPADADDPDGTGSLNLLDRLEGIVEALAVHPQGRAEIELLDQWWETLILRACGDPDGTLLGSEALTRHAAEMCREFGELLSECRPGACDHERLAREGSDVLAAVGRLVRAAYAARGAAS